MEPDTRNHWLVVVAAGLAVFMATVDASIVNLALPAIGRDFAASPGQTEWTVLGYLLPMTALILPAGRWLDSVGRRPAMVLAVGGFAVASAAGAASPALSALTAARMAQGAFGAMIAAQVPALVTQAVQPGARGRALGIIGALGPLGAASGPAVGGILVETMGWRSVFLVNVPVSLIVTALMRRHLAPAAERLRGPGRSQLTNAVLLAGACGALLAGLTLATSHGIAWLALVLPAVPLLAAWFRRPDGRAVRAIAAPGLRASLSALAMLAMAGSGVQYLMPFFMIRFLHASAVHTGLAVLAYPLAMGLTAPVGGLLADRWSARRTALTGAWMVAVADLLLCQTSVSVRPVDLSWRLTLVGLGMGLFSGPNQTTIMNLAPRHALATAGAATALTRSLGFALGPALCTLIWAASGYSATGLKMALLLPVSTAAAAGITLGAGKPASRRRHQDRQTPGTPSMPMKDQGQVPVSAWSAAARACSRVVGK